MDATRVGMMGWIVVVKLDVRMVERMVVKMVVRMAEMTVFVL